MLAREVKETYFYTVSPDAEGVFKVRIGEHNTIIVEKPNHKGEIVYDNMLEQMVDEDYRQATGKALKKYEAGEISRQELVIEILEAFTEHLNMKVFMRCTTDHLTDKI